MFEFVERLVGRIAENGDDERTVPKSERRQFDDVESFLVDQVLADNAKVGRAESDVLGDVVVPAVEDREREVAAARQQLLPVALEFESNQAQQ